MTVKNNYINQQVNDNKILKNKQKLQYPLIAESINLITLNHLNHFHHPNHIPIKQSGPSKPSNYRNLLKSPKRSLDI